MILIREIADEIAKIQGWEVECDRKNIICNRSGKASTTSIDVTPRPLAAGPLKQNCGWKVELDLHVKLRIIQRHRNQNNINLNGIRQ